MSTKKTTDTDTKFDSGSKSTYDSMQGGIGSVLNAYMKGGVDSNPFYRQALGQAQNQINAIGTRNTQNVMNGYAGGNMSGFKASMLAANARNQSTMQGNAFVNQLLQSQQNQMWATGQAAGYRPLQTGQKTTEQTSGTGTWLPQLAGAAIGAGMMAATGGASSGLGAALGGANALIPTATGATSNFSAATSGWQGNSPSYGFWSPQG